MILDEIKKANVQAMKDRDANARSIYGILMNKAMLETIRKRERDEELNDSDMVAILQKTIKELAEEGENYAKVGNGEMEQNIAKQKDIVEKFLPQMMSVDEIKKIILGMEDRSVPSVMKKFKSEFAGKCDMRLVSEVLKSL